MANHSRVFNYQYGVNKVVSVDVTDIDIEIVVIAENGELVETRMDHAGFFERKPIPGMWMVDGHLGERFFVDDAGLKRLGEENTDQAKND
ncbi:hypothetical protein VLI38_002193 [Enterobacter roggenkampii]|nr:hypothetical protein [Enterobacter roggenkampii]